jgi:dethiobiotin synthetase
MSGVFITATGTDIGKTFMARGLIRALRRAGREIDALKPIVSGFEPAEAEGSDSGLLLSALGRTVTADEIAHISPWRFAAPLSPDMAAAREGRRIDFDQVIHFCRTALSAARGTVLIEGVGGVMVPLGQRRTVLDWMAELKLPVLLVAGSYLGTISHTLTALDVLARRGLAVSAVVISQTAGSPVGLEETRDAIARFESGLEVVALPRLPPGSVDHAVFDRIATRL